MKKKTGKLHRAWLILAGVILIQAGFVGIAINSISVLFSAILVDTGFRAGDLSLYYMIRSLTMAVFVTPLSNVFFSPRGRRLMVVLGLMTGCSIGAMGLFSSIWQWYVAGVTAGIGNSICLAVLPVVINNWFKSKKGFANGLATAASGIAGALFSPVCSYIIEKWGWRATAMVMMAAIILLVVPAAILILRNTPQEAGCQPFYVGEGEKVVQKETRYLEHVPKYLFLMMAAVVSLAMMTVQFCMQIPIFAASVGYSPMVGAMLTSLVMLGNVGGKMSFGVLTDKIGVFATSEIGFAISGVSLFLLAFYPQVLPCLYAGSLCLGVIYSLGTVAVSLLALDIYDFRHYKPYVSKLVAMTQLVSAVSSPIIAYAYDFFGTYKPVLILGAAVCLFCILLLMTVKHCKERLLLKERQI